MDQISRITGNEAILDEAAELIKTGEVTERLSYLVGRLEGYYLSEAWRRDFEDDEKGLIPKDIKRGVLSEDGIYNILEAFSELSRLPEGEEET